MEVYLRFLNGLYLQGPLQLSQNMMKTLILWVTLYPRGQLLVPKRGACTATRMSSQAQTPSFLNAGLPLMGLKLKKNVFWSVLFCRSQSVSCLPFLRMTQHLMSFGLGTRVCGGQNLARMMLRMILATVVRNFDIYANTVETNERTMKIMDAFVRKYHFAFIRMLSCWLFCFRYHSLLLANAASPSSPGLARGDRWRMTLSCLVIPNIFPTKPRPPFSPTDPHSLSYPWRLFFD